MHFCLALSGLDLIILISISGFYFCGIAIMFSLFQYLFTVLNVLHFKIFKNSKAEFLTMA